jgi:hypothetical protein
MESKAQPGERETELGMLSAGGTYRVWSPGPEAPRFISELLSINETLETTAKGMVRFTTLQFENRTELRVKDGDPIRFFRRPR